MPPDYLFVYDLIVVYFKAMLHFSRDCDGHCDRQLSGTQVLYLKGKKQNIIITYSISV